MQAVLRVDSGWSHNPLGWVTYPPPRALMTLTMHESQKTRIAYGSSGISIHLTVVLISVDPGMLVIYFTESDMEANFEDEGTPSHSGR